MATTCTWSRCNTVTGTWVPSSLNIRVIPSFLASRPVRRGWGMALNLDLNVHAGGEVELHQRVHRLRGWLHDVEQAAMGPDFELLAAFLVDVGGTIDCEALDMGRQRDRSANAGT